MDPSGKVQFVYVIGDELPAEIDDSTVYVVGTEKKSIYIGSTLIVSDYYPATSTSDGLMSSADKIKLDSIPQNIIHSNTTAYWDARPSLIGQAGHIYVYTDHDHIGDQDIPGMKIGDGLAYLIDAPFVDGNASALINHMNDMGVHITPQERNFWNNKVRCFLSNVDNENIIFITD